MAIGAWALTGLASPPAAAEVTGFSGSFDPSTWLVVNTTPADPIQLKGVFDNPGPPTTSSTLCSTSTSTGNPGPNEVACVESYDITTGDLSLLSSFQVSDNSVPGGGFDLTPRTTTLTLTNPYPSDYEYRRVYLISFNWSFGGPMNSPPGDSQSVSITSTAGVVYLNNTQYYEQFTSNPGELYTDITTLVYLPMGATLNFTIATDNSQDTATFSLTGFDYVEIPAPLPISGACMFFASSRRLRGRLRKSSQNVANSNSAGTPGSFAHPGASYSSALPAAIHRYSARLGLPLPDGQGPLPLRATSLHASRQHPSDRPAAIGTAFNQPLQSASM